MRPIRFVCHATVPLSGTEIMGRMLEMNYWSEFPGYGPLPGIERAEFDTRTEDVVGSRIRVTNQDGSTHVEQIVAWDLGEHVKLVMQDFTAPLSLLAESIEETWDFETAGGESHVVRTFTLSPRCWCTYPAVWLISRLLKRAADRHLEQMKTGHTDQSQPEA